MTTNPKQSEHRTPNIKGEALVMVTVSSTFLGFQFAVKGIHVFAKRLLRKTIELLVQPIAYHLVLANETSVFVSEIVACSYEPPRHDHVQFGFAIITDPNSLSTLLG